MTLFRRWGRRRAPQREAITDALWQRTLAHSPFLDGLTEREDAKLRELVTAFLAEKELVGVAGMELTDEMRLAIGVQACLPILNLGLACYSGWVGVVVYPGEFRVRREELDESGVVHQWDDDISGEAFPGGPVVLSWEDIAMSAEGAEDGYNVVIHEFAHKLDALSGEADGVPPAPPGFGAQRWLDVLRTHFDAFCALVDSDADVLPFDEYAAEHPAEFFAVMSEAFFTQPDLLEETYPDLYAALAAFYRQDPLARLQAIRNGDRDASGGERPR